MREKGRAKRISRLGTSRAGDDLRRHTLRISEKGTLVRIAPVDSRSERREMGANRLWFCSRRQ